MPTEGVATSRPDFTAATPSGQRLAFLDVLRGLAALSVCLQHVLERYASFSNFSRDWFNLGAFGVVAFFLVSGFIIPASLQKYGSLRRFWWGRVCRLYPMYFVALLIALALDVYTHQPACGNTSHQALCVAVNLTFLQEYFGIWTVVSVAWTLSLEMVFYVLCSIAFAAAWHKREVIMAYAATAVLLLAAVAAELLHHSVPFGRLGLLALCFYGMLFHGVYQGRVSASKLVPTGLLLLVALAVGFWQRVSMHRVDNYGEGFTFRSLCISWGVGLLCFCVLFFLRRRSMPAAMQWLGRVSYSFYLLAWAVPLVRVRFLPGDRWDVLDVVLPIAMSAVTYRWIERPFMRFSAQGAEKPGHATGKL